MLKVEEGLQVGMLQVESLDQLPTFNLPTFNLQPLLTCNLLTFNLQPCKN